jgi:hypothetical protein
VLESGIEIVTPLLIVTGLINIAFVLACKVALADIVFGVTKNPFTNNDPVPNIPTFDDPATLTVTLPPELPILTFDVPFTIALGVDVIPVS